MRIAQVSPLFESVPPRQYGGTERVVSWLTEELVSMGHQVTLFASGDSTTAARLVPGRPQAIRLEGTCQDPVARHVAMVEKVYDMAAEFDVIHWHIDYTHFPASRREMRPHLTTLHGRLDIADLLPLYRQYQGLPLVSISDAQRRPLDFAHWIGTVHHGMPVDSYRPGSGQGQYLAFLGRFSPEKGADQAIEIARRVGVPIKLAAKVAAQDQAYFDSVIKPRLSEPHVEYLGEIGEKDKNEFLGNALALLFPIDWPEPFGLVMIEAMACGTPVIAYPRGSVPEVLEDHVSGRLASSLDEAVDAVGALPSRASCRQAFEQRFSVTTMAQAYLDLYRGLQCPPAHLPASHNGVPQQLQMSA